VVPTDAEFVAKNHYDKTKREVAQAWLNEYRAKKAAHAIKSVDAKELSKKRFDSLGSVKELNKQMIGCNDYKSDFAIK
jgi:hypothetical protein